MRRRLARLRRYLRALLAGAVGGLLAACVAHAVPYTVEYRVGEWRVDWFSDGPDPSKVLEVNNPLPTDAIVMVACESAIHPERPNRWRVRVPARGSVRAFIQVMNRDVLFDVCQVESWEEVR